MASYEKISCGFQELTGFELWVSLSHDSLSSLGTFLLETYSNRRITSSDPAWSWLGHPDQLVKQGEW